MHKHVSADSLTHIIAGIFSTDSLKHIIAGFFLLTV